MRSMLTNYLIYQKKKTFGVEEYHIRPLVATVNYEVGALPIMYLALTLEASPRPKSYLGSSGF